MTMTPQWTKKLGGLAAGLLLVALCCACSSSQHPSDQILIEKFQAHRSEFDHLLLMFVADKELYRVAHGFTRPEDPQTVGVTQERLAAYRELFAELGLSAGIEGYNEKDVVLFHASTSGLSISGSSKGYAYMRERPDLVVSNLDTYEPRNVTLYTAFRHIEGNWYLYFHRDF